jgi:aspartate aminotransferase-like enzyme
VAPAAAEHRGASPRASTTPGAPRLLRDFDLEIGAGLGALAGKAWRIGLMGHASRERNVITC